MAGRRLGYAGPLFGPRRHPRTHDRFRSLLALWSLPQLLGGFLLLLAGLGALVGLGYWRTADGGSHTYWFWFRESSLLLAGLATTTTSQDEYGAHAIFQIVGAVGGVVTPALALGIVVFKAFVKDRVFVIRSQLALLDPAIVEKFPNQPGDVDRWLAIRLYSGTKLQLVKLNFELFARVKSKSPTKSSIVANASLALFKDHWPVGLPHVPYTLYSPVRADEWTLDGKKAKLQKVRAVDGREYDLAEGCDLLLIITGEVPELGTDLVESHWFTGAGLSCEPFGEIELKDYPKNRKTWRKSRKWSGWGNFDAAA